MDLITLYARKEPTTDRVAIGRGLHTLKDVVLSKDKDFTQPCARYGPDRSDRPDRRFKYTTLNCWRWKLEWVRPA